MSLMSFALLAALAPAQVGAVDLGGDRIEIAGVGQQRTIPCEGRPVEVAGTGHDLTFTGDCAGLDLKGSGNRVTIDLKPGAPLNVEGIDQTVRWRSSTQPRQSVAGVGNSIVRLRD